MIIPGGDKPYVSSDGASNASSSVPSLPSLHPKVVDLMKDIAPTILTIGTLTALTRGRALTLKGRNVSTPMLTKVPSKHVVRSGIENFIHTSKTKGVSEGLLKSMERSSPHLIAQMAVQEVRGMQNRATLNHNADKTDEVFTKRFGDTYDNLLAPAVSVVVGGILTWLIEQEKEKKDSLKDKLNQNLDGLKQVGRELGELQKTEEIKRAQDLEAALGELNSLIGQLPEEERAVYHEQIAETSWTLNNLYRALMDTIAQEIAQIEGLSPLEVDVNYTASKDLAAQLTAPIIGLAVSVAFCRFGAAKDMAKKLADILHVRPESINKVIGGFIGIVAQELVKKGTTQNVTKPEVDKFANEALKEMGIPSQKPNDSISEGQNPTSANKEKKIEECISNSILGTFSKVISCLTQNSLFADLLEAAVNSTLKTAVSDNVEGAIGFDDASKYIKDVFDKPISILKKHAELLKTASEADKEAFAGLKTVIQERIQELAIIKAMSSGNFSNTGSLSDESFVPNIVPFKSVQVPETQIPPEPESTAETK